MEQLDGSSSEGRVEGSHSPAHRVAAEMLRLCGAVDGPSDELVIMENSS